MKIKMRFLTEVAEIEPRPSKDKIYPIGTIIIQISATIGEVLYLRKESKIEDRYAVISPKEQIQSFYLFSIIEKYFPKFFLQYKQGLNFKAEDLKRFKLPVHEEQKQRNIIAKMMMLCGCEPKKFYENLPTI
ncbi:restriction endonuclease subunit S [Histophilus somni]|uniref:restriction endonuclease subunit S n=1 Tax=Histophilus somni TaxID=731 RepID=UPI00201F2880|nr:restriction endonuclease subunit S [Histophilus somni]